MELKNETRNRVPSSGAELGTRIGKIADLIGSRKSASEVAAIAIATLQRHIAGDASPTFDATARLCLATGVRMEWLATGEGPMLASETVSESPVQGQAFDWQRLARAMRIIQDVAASTGGTIDMDKLPALLRSMYETLAERDDHNDEG